MSSEKDIIDGVAKNPMLARGVIDVLWGGVLTLGGMLGGFFLKRHGDEMKELKLKLEQLDEGVEEVKSELHNGFVKADQFEQNRKEMREGIIALHGKIETSLGTVHTKIDSNHREIMSALLNHVSKNGK